MARRKIVRRAEQRNKERHTLSAQLVVGQDDALIEWLLSIPAGERSQVVKQALLRSIEMPPIEEYNNSIQPVNFTDEHAAQRIAQLESIVQRLIEQQNQWNTYIDGRLNALSQSPVNGAVDIIESTPKITDEKREKRKTNLKKASW